MVGHDELMRARIVAYRVWVQKHDRKGPLVRHRGRCESNIKMGLQQI
jgi:hypothetical protein